MASINFRRRLLMTAVAVLGVLAPNLAVAATVYTPAELNEKAIQLLLQGKISSARVLLERAVVLAPKNKTLRDNLDALKSHGGAVRLAQKSQAVGETTTPAQAATTDSRPEFPVPAIWPLTNVN